MPTAAKRADDFPRRVNKHLAVLGHDTRRGADLLIREGRVTINGRVAKAGDWVEEGDEVRVRAGKSKRHTYVAYHKPLGVVTHSPREGQADIRHASAKAGVPRDLFPLGRLDRASSGLIVLTNDGRITDRLLNPAFAHDKEYVVTTKARVGPSFKRIMEKGVDIGGYVTRPARVSLRGDREFSICLQEGKKHQIRRMVVALRNEVESLRRVRVMNVKLGHLKPGAARAIEGDELREFLGKLGL